MRELLKNAWLGWNRYTDAGKFAALFFAALLFAAVWHGSRSRGEQQKHWKQQERKAVLTGEAGGVFIYAGLMAAACVFPPTAAALMLYQTRFYDYEWIWSLVPVTVVIACGGTIFLGKIGEDYIRKKKKPKHMCSIAAGAVLAVILVCGSMGQTSWSDGADQEGRDQAAHFLAQLMEDTDQPDICLWAPREIMECARAYSGRFRLPYGRNMWDRALGAYTYESYDETRQELYQWMSRAEETGALQCTVEVLSADGTGEIHSSKKQLDGLLCIRNALDMGVNCILLPGAMDPGALEEISRELKVEVVDWNGYYLLKTT